MKIVRVIPAKVWVNKHTGAKVSLYGSLPYTNENDKLYWDLQTVGFTWELENGTIGLGRKPAATQEEAEEIMHTLNEHYYPSSNG